MTGVEQSERLSESYGPAAGADGGSPARELGPLAAALRFPIPPLCAAGIAAVGGLSHIFWGREPDELLVQTLLATGIAGFFASLLFALIAEARDWRRWKGACLGVLATMAFLPFFESQLLEGEPSFHPAVLMASASLFLLSMLTPALSREAHPDATGTFTSAVMARAKAGIWVAILLGMPALAAALYLSSGHRYQPLRFETVGGFLFFMVPIWAWWFLAGLPTPGSNQRPLAAPRRWTGAIRAPLGILCVLLLYVVPAVAWFTSQRADWLALGLTATAALIWLTTNPRENTDRSMDGLYRRFFLPAAALPLLFMSFLSIGSQDQSAGTAGGYLVMLSGLWVTGLSLYDRFRPGQAAIAAPLFLATLLAAGSFGPWGLWQFTTNTRIAQLERLLTDAGLLAGGRIAEMGAITVPRDVRAEGERILRGLYSSGRDVAAGNWIKSLQSPRVSDDPEIADIYRYLDSQQRYPTLHTAMVGTRLAVLVVPELPRTPTDPAPRPSRTNVDGKLIVVPQLAPETSTPDPDRDITLIGPWALGVKSDVIPVSGYAVVENIAMVEDGSTSREVITQDSGDRFRIQFPSSDGVVSVTMPDGHGIDLDLIAYALKHKTDQYILENRKGPLRAKIILTYMNVRRSPDGEYRLTDFRGLIAVGREAGE